MAETEVEIILREIRERVLSEQRTTNPTAGSRRAATATVGNGARDLANREAARQQDNEIPAEEHLALIRSYLTTTARAWDRLPPLVSNRSGTIARLELWLKRNLKRATRWYAWEQVNFNAAVHHSLRDLLSLLSTHEQELTELRAQLTQSEQHKTELTAQLTQLRAEFDTRLAGLSTEVRERAEHLLDEQRVSFKQLALETSEAAVLEDRARRKTEALLEELTRRVEQLEKK
ncbi:MAG TPA: hypothetical protein VGO73_12365 [Pyrinomonadaceae bacterium]|jgi:hypothetical protein|nr:hypothetical protein [Pyrinomonadaceae bacterium]